MDIEVVGKLREEVIFEIAKAVVGKTALVEDVLSAVLAGHHVLFEDYPGLGKTLVARSIATVLGLSFKRIQFTPDLLPQDIVGAQIYDRKTEGFRLEKGPVFANIVLADEINRASPRTQSALLEAMQERQVTIEGETFALPDPFIVLATQNPIEYEGTFPLPEAELDRFGVKLSVGYPDEKEENDILVRRIERAVDEAALKAVTGIDEVRAAITSLESVFVHPDILDYVVRVVGRTRNESTVAVGASPRASLALLKLARARAALSGRAFVLPDDVKRFAPVVLSHRLVLNPEYWLKAGMANDIVKRILEEEAVPVIGEP